MQRLPSEAGADGKAAVDGLLYSLGMENGAAELAGPNALSFINKQLQANFLQEQAKRRKQARKTPPAPLAGFHNGAAEHKPSDEQLTANLLSLLSAGALGPNNSSAYGGYCNENIPLKEEVSAPPHPPSPPLSPRRPATRTTPPAPSAPTATRPRRRPGAATPRASWSATPAASTTACTGSVGGRL